MASITDFATDDKGRPAEPAEVVTSGGTRIYLLPIETFPGHVNNVYLVDHPDYPLLFDVGTQSGHAELRSRFQEVEERFGVKTGAG